MEAASTEAGIEERIAAKREKLKDKLPVAVSKPLEPWDIRANCAGWYSRNDPHFGGVKSSVDHFIEEIHASTEEVGLKDDDALALIPDLVILGLAVMKKPASTKPLPMLHGKDRIPNFSHHFAIVREGVYGYPFLAKCLEELTIMAGTADYLYTMPQDALYREGMLVQADKLRKMVVKKLSKPIGGMALDTYMKEVISYRDVISHGWRDFIRFKENVRKWKRPRHRTQRGPTPQAEASGASHQPRPATSSELQRKAEATTPPKPAQSQGGETKPQG